MAEGAKPTVSDLGEFALIDRVAGRVSPPDPGFISTGIGDDCAVVRVDEDRAWLLSTDLLVEAIHFRRAWTTPEQLGWKAIAVNLSDLAAMGALPRCATIALSLPSDLPVAWVDSLFAGADDVATQFGLSVVGGDLTASPSGVTIAVTVLGEAPRQGVLLRSGAQPGDALVVTGSLGDATAGLRLLENDADEELRALYADQLSAHLTPVPRIEAGRVASEAGCVHAAIDLSDGLFGDLGHLCRQSEVGAEVELEQLPISEGCRAVAEQLGASPTEWATAGGEDYELLLAVAPTKVDILIGALGSSGLPATAIGRVRDQATGIRARRTNGDWEPVGTAFDHFRT